MSLYSAYYGGRPDLFAHDYRLRPAHYTDAHVRTLHALERGEDVPEADITELIFQHQRKSLPTFERPKAKPKPKPKRLTVEQQLAAGLTASGKPIKRLSI